MIPDWDGGRDAPSRKTYSRKRPNFSVHFWKGISGLDRVPAGRTPGTHQNVPNVPRALTLWGGKHDFHRTPEVAVSPIVGSDMSEMVCYFDESNRGQVWAVAGYVASAKTWEESFIPAWSRALRGSARPISEYKAAKCNNGRGEFSNWNPHDRDALTRSVVSFIAECCLAADMVGFATALVLSGTPDPSSERITEFRRNLEEVGYGRCMGMTLYLALLPAIQLSGGDRVRVIVDRKVGFSQRITSNFKIAREVIADPDLVERISPPEAGDSKELLPLQAADLLAHETVKEVWNRVEGRPVRGSLQALVDARFHRARCFDFPPLAEVERIHATGEQAPINLHELFKSEAAIRAAGNWNCGGGA